MRFVTVVGLNLMQNVPNADVGRPRDTVDGERPLSPAVFMASAAPLNSSGLFNPGRFRLAMNSQCNLPMLDDPPHATARLQAMFSALVSASWPPFAKWRRSRLAQRHHFGSLNDQTLADIGLQRSAMRAAEYGIMPTDQVLSVACDQNAANDRCACCK